MNKNLLEEIRRFKLMVDYDPTEVLSEQVRIVEAVTFFGVTNLYYVKKEDYVNAKHIGYIEDNTKKMVLNKDGQKILNRLNVPFEQLLAQGEVVTDTFLEKFVEDEESKMTNLNQTLKSVGGADWKNTTNGSGVLNPSNVGKYPVATNITGPYYEGTQTYNLLCAEVRPNYVPTTVEETGPTITKDLGDFQIGSSNKVFCDNMVKVNLNDETNKKELETIVKQISDYISSPDDENGVTAISKLDYMTIRGQADSARPTWSPGAPCNQSTTELDHDYGGIEKKPKDQTSEEERHKMNKYLATMRAKNYKDEIIKRVKETTGKDITITELDALDHYGKGDSFRGPQYRSMIFKANAPKHIYKSIDTSGKSTRVVNYENIIRSGAKPARINNLPTGRGDELNLKVIVKDGGDFYAEANETLKKDFTDYTSVALPEISVDWGGSIPSLNVTTWDSKTYSLPMVKDENGICAVFKKIGQSALAAHFLNGPQTFRIFKRCSSFEEDLQPVTYYESSKSIMVNGKTFYKLIFFGFVLVPVALMGDDYIQWPSEEQIRDQKQYQNKNYSAKQLQKIKDLAYM